MSAITAVSGLKSPEVRHPFVLGRGQGTGFWCVLSLPSQPQHLVNQIVLLQLHTGAQLGFSIKDYEQVKCHSSREGMVCLFFSFNRVVTSQKCQDGKITKENSIMIPLNMEH